MKKLVLALSLILVIGLFAGCGKKDEDKVVFTSGDIEVTLGEVNYYLFQLKSYYEQQGGADIWNMPLSEEETFGEAMKGNLKDVTVRSDLIEQLAKDLGLEIAEERLEEIKKGAAEEIVQYQQLPEELLEKYYITEERIYDAQVKAEYSSLYFAEVTKDFVIDEAVVDEVLAADLNYQKILEVGVETYNQEVRARHILVSFLDEAGTKLEGDALDAKLALAEELLQRAIDGEDFATLATENTDDPGSVETGGEYTFGRGRMVPEFEEAAFGLEEGGISGIVETSYGYHIIKLEEKLPVTDEQVTAAEASLQSIRDNAEYQQRYDAFGAIVDEEFAKIEITVDEDLWADVSFSDEVADEVPAE